MSKKIISDKSEKLAKIIYEAIVRYINSKNTEIGEKTHHTGLTYLEFGGVITPVILTRWRSNYDFEYTKRSEHNQANHCAAEHG